MTTVMKQTGRLRLLADGGQSTVTTTAVRNALDTKPSAGAVARAKATMLLLMPYWAIEGQPSDFPLAHQEIALALDAFAREQAHWQCDLCHCCGEKRHDGGDPCVSCEATAREREAAVWEEGR